MTMLKRILTIAIFIAVTLSFAGCQTLGGLGGDLKWTGEQIEAGAANCTIPPPDSNK